VAIVPLGLTRYNTDERLTAVTPEFCRQTIAAVTAIQQELSQPAGHQRSHSWEMKFICAPAALCLDENTTATIPN